MSERILKELLWLAVSILLTALFVRLAFSERGYFAYGGEWLVMPTFLIARQGVNEITAEIKEVLNDNRVPRNKE